MELPPEESNAPLNDAAAAVLRHVDPGFLRVSCDEDAPGRLWDCGVDAPGGTTAGLLLADVCTAGLAETSLAPGTLGGTAWPQVVVRTDHAVEACLLSQYAGWSISVDGYFGMGSGPMRAAAAVEELFGDLAYRESAHEVVGVVESGEKPGRHIYEYLAEKCGVPIEYVTLCVAPTASQAGNVQVVARAVETAMHKLHELKFDVRRVVSGFGTAPLPPVAKDDLAGIGRTNDAILYGGTVHLWATGDDDTLADVVKKVPSSASEAHGRPFLEIFESAGCDFYAIDPHLFSPAVIVLHNLETGVVHRAGALAEDVVLASFGLG